MQLIDLPADPLLAIFFDLDVEDVLSLKQSCRVLYTLGSLDCLWHKLVRTCNLPLDIPLGADSSTLSGQELQVIVIKALKLDHHWRKSDARVKQAIPIIRSDTFYVENMHLLPGGKWLISTQHIPSSVGERHTDLTLWCLEDTTSPRSIKTIPIHGRTTSCRAYYQPVQCKFTIAIALEKDRSMWIEVHHISLDNSAVVSTQSESMMLQPVASDGPFLVTLLDMRIYGDVLGATYYQDLGQGRAHTVNVYLCNLVTGATTTFKAYTEEWSYNRPCFELFRDQFALASHDPSETIVSFYDIPSSIISAHPNSDSSANPNRGHMSEDLLSARFRPSRCSSFHHRISSGSVEHGIPILNIMMFDWLSQEGTVDRFSPPIHETRFSDRFNIDSQAFDLYTQGITAVQLGATGRRAVWVDAGGDSWMLRKWSAPRYCRGEELPDGVSVLMPSSSGLPFNLKDISKVAFDEATCRLCISVTTGGLYVCDFL
ncbi:hypothetical protein BJ138DRAFT_883503 [Hygrophoropsis aurantiaca]|uniref:Uncharacterized protein n=1 Tax=Hygrophoropsis aurantiaca TaxID=72124 RepID=A0ACB8AGU1_9AGAM|nr:hypothetical protein BJ138DRAFT_883503 [Hygrophoropsis aurantiaca]